MSASPAVPDPRSRERLHPLFLLTGLGKVIRGAWGLAVGGAFLAFKGNVLLAAILFGGFILVSLGSLLIKWVTFEFRVGEDELTIEQGLLSRSNRAIPFDRVTDVDIEQGPIHRLLGLARVRMETGAAAGAKDTEGTLDTIALHRAEAIRDFVRARKRGAVSSESPVAAVDGEPLFAMDSRRVMIAGLFNFSLAIIAVLFGASQTVGDLVGFEPFNPDFWMSMVASNETLRTFVLAHQVITVVAGAATLMLIGTATGIVRTLLREHGFRLDRTESGLRRRRGLLTLTDVTIPARRIQAAILATGPVRRRFGWFTLKMQSLASDGAQGDHVVAPLAHADEAAAIQQSLDRPIAPSPAAWRAVPFAFVSSMAIPLAVLALVPVGIGLLVHPAALLAVGGLGLAIAVRFAEWKHTRYALDDGILFIESGWWKHRRAILPVARIQSLDLAENAWTRLFGFCRMRLGVAGGTLLSAFAIDALGREDAEALRARLLGS
jgi:putative membrane protein